MPPLDQLLTVGLQASPRSRPLVDDTVRSFRHAGFPGPLTIFAEPDTQISFHNEVAYHFHPYPHGAFQNWKALALHLLQTTSTPWLMLMQDDVQWRPRAAQVLHSAIAKFDPLRVGCLSPYTSAAMVPEFAKRQSDVYQWVEAQFSNKAFIGAQALCFPRATLTRLVSHPDFLAHTHHRKIDVLIGNLLRRRLQLPIRVHVPSLAEHSGWNCSTLGRDRIAGIQWSRKGFRFAEGMA
jgi:hypothetical protein